MILFDTMGVCFSFFSFFQKEGPVEKKIKDAEKELLNDWAILSERKGCGLECKEEVHFPLR